MFKQIGRNIKILRNKKNLSQSDLGERLNVTRQQIANYEKGDTTIPLSSITTLSSIFGIPIDFLVKFNLSNYTDTKLDGLLSNVIGDNSSLIKEITSVKHKHDNLSATLLDNYLKSIVKEELAPVKDLLHKVLMKIDLTDLKYELSEEIKNANILISEKQDDT